MDCFDYDKEADVLYINVEGKPQKADFGKKTGNYIVRFKKDGSIVGITILNAQEFIKRIIEAKRK